MACLTDMTAAIAKLRREIPDVLQPLLASAVCVARAEITNEIQAVAKISMTARLQRSRGSSRCPSKQSLPRAPRPMIHL